MKDAKTPNEYEPTIKDVLEAVQTGFARLENGHDRHERILVTLQQGQELLNGRVGDVERRLAKTQNRVEDIAEMLEKNIEKTNKHELRIARLEKVCV